MLCLASYSRPAVAETACDEERPSFCVTPLKINEPAPYEGQLLTTELAIDQALRLEYGVKEHQAELERLRSLHKIELDYMSRLHQADITNANKRESELSKRLVASEAALAAQDSPLNSPTLWFGLGVVGGILLVLIAAEALQASAN